MLTESASPLVRVRDRGAQEISVRTAVRVERAAWLLSGATIAVHAWLYRFEMINLDGISYLELAWAWRDGRWDAAVNAYWSPLYSWLLAIALAMLNPPPYWEYPLVHLVNLVGACGALAAFAYLIRGFPWGRAATAQGRSRAIEIAAVYGVFLWSSIVLLVAWMECPDMVLAAFVYLAAGGLVRIAYGDRRTSTYALFGGALGLAYLTKSAMMPLAAVFFAAAVLAGRSAPLRGAWIGDAGRVAVAVAVFLAIAGPWVAAVSAAKERFTFGDSGRINYVWFVNGSENWPHNWPPHWPHWSGEPDNGVPIHPARQLHADPAVYAFEAPVGGTYPAWHDPSWFYEGIGPHWDFVDQIRRIKISLGDLYRILALNPYNYQFFNPQPAMLAVLVVIVAGSRRLAAGPVFRPRPCLWMPGAAAIAMYSLVYVEPRYLGAFVALLWLAAIDALAPARSAGAGALRRAGLTVMAAALAAAVFAATWIEAYPAARRLLRGEADREPQAWITSQQMREAGVEPREPIAIAGNAQVATRWTHLLRTKIVAEVPARDAWKLWGAAGPAHELVSDAFRRAGARWFVLEQPRGELPQGWRRVPGTPYAIRLLE